MVKGLTDSDSVDHDRNFGETPSHNECAYAQMFLESSSEGNETTDIQGDSNVTSPKADVSRRRINVDNILPKSSLGYKYTLVPSN